MLVRSGREVSADDVVSRIGLPCFVKPNEGGSSFGVSKCRTAADIIPAIEKAMKEIGYSLILNTMNDLPNGKALQRLDFQKVAETEDMEYHMLI